MIFKYYGVEYKAINGKKEDSDYKKIPVVVTNGVQINDSFIIVKSFARILCGLDLTPELLEVEQMTTSGLMIALEVAVAGSCTELNKCASKMDCCFCMILSSCSCLICCMAPGYIRDKHPALQNLEFYKSSYTVALGDKKYFHGENPGIVDISICGVLAPFIHADNEFVREFLGANGKLKEWYDRIRPVLPNIF